MVNNEKERRLRSARVVGFRFSAVFFVSGVVQYNLVSLISKKNSDLKQVLQKEQIVLENLSSVSEQVKEYLSTNNVSELEQAHTNLGVAVDSLKKYESDNLKPTVAIAETAQKKVSYVLDGLVLGEAREEYLSSTVASIDTSVDILKSIPTGKDGIVNIGYSSMLLSFAMGTTLLYSAIKSHKKLKQLRRGE